MSMRGQMIQAYEVRIHKSQLEPDFLTQGNNLRIGQWWCLVHRLAGFPSWMLFGDQQWNPKQKHNFLAWSRTTPVWDSFLVKSLLFLARPDRPAHHLIEIFVVQRMIWSMTRAHPVPGGTPRWIPSPPLPPVPRSGETPLIGVVGKLPQPAKAEKHCESKDGQLKMVANWPSKKDLTSQVVEPTPLKKIRVPQLGWWSSLKFPTDMKHNIHVPVTTNQI